MIMLGMGAGPGADAQYLFSEDVLGHTSGHKPRHAKTYRNFRAEDDRLQRERIARLRRIHCRCEQRRVPGSGACCSDCRR